tara:strand:- start:27 stop:326 length:300 start_codon:yes stop_codon:yes gene_type:complete
MCLGGGGGSNRPPQQSQRDAPEAESAAVTENKNRNNLKTDASGSYSEGTLGGSGMSGGGGRKGSYWKNNPTWDQQWYDKGYKEGDWVSTRNQSDKNYGS